MELRDIRPGGMVPIDQKNGQSARRTILNAKLQIRKNICEVIASLSKDGGGVRFVADLTGMPLDYVALQLSRDTFSARFVREFALGVEAHVAGIRETLAEARLLVREAWHLSSNETTTDFKHQKWPRQTRKYRTVSATASELTRATRPRS